MSREVAPRCMSHYIAPARVMPMTAIQAAWPSFTRTEEDDADEEDGDDSNDDYDKPDAALVVDSTDEKSIYIDESQSFIDEPQYADSGEICDNEIVRAPVNEEQRRKRDPRLRELLLNYPKCKLESHRFDEDFPDIVDAFIREHSEEFTPEMPGALPLLLMALYCPFRKRCLVLWLDLGSYHNPPGETVVDLVRTLVSGNQAFLAKIKKERDEGKPTLDLQDFSFNRNVTTDHINRILKLTRLRELRIWDNPGLAAVSSASITKLTSRVSLDQLDADQLAKILNPRFKGTVQDAGLRVPISGETVKLPLHDFWWSLHEVYPSLVRFKHYIAKDNMYRGEQAMLEKRWQLKLPLLIATGREDNKSAVTSPFRADLFGRGWHESISSGSRRNFMYLHGFEAIVPGESTLVILQEPDLGLVHHGIATRAPEEDKDTAVRMEQEDAALMEKEEAALMEQEGAEVKEQEDVEVKKEQGVEVKKEPEDVEVKEESEEQENHQARPTKRFRRRCS